MNAKSIFALVFLVSLVLSACAPSARPTAIAVAPQNSAPQPYVPTPAPMHPSNLFPPEPAQAPPNTRLPFPGTLPTPVDNYFRDYGVNPFVDSFTDHLSTFALDVDTASYSVARRYVMDGNLPPADAVRVEEFVNSFEQDYPNPPDVAFGVYADGAPSPFHEDGTYILRFGVQGYQVPDAARKPAVLTFVIDVSGSMSEQGRLELVKQSLQLLVDRLRPHDSVAIVAYTNTAWVVLNPTGGEDRTSILSAIYSLEPMQTTNAEAGIRLGYRLANAAFQPGSTNRVILCSDGVANVGATGPEEILKSIRSYADAGISLTSLGFGMGNFNDVLLEQLADNGNGNYAYVDTLDEARELFVNDLTSTLQVIALDAKVQVDFNPDTVAYYRLIGYENRAVADQDFRNNAVDAGEIGAGHSATALYAVLLYPGAQGRLATVQLRWQDPDTREVKEINGNFNTWDLVANFESASPRYQLDVVVAQYAELLRDSPWTGYTSIYSLRNYALRLGDLLPEDPDVAEFVRLVSRAAHIEALTSR
jgi:Ca-activated chloride channel family protein